MTKKQLFHHAGQTLIEALVTVLFIAIGVIALIRFQHYLAYDNSLAQQRGDAMVIATNRLEILKEFQVFNNTAGYTSYQSIATGSGTIPGANTNYTVSWTVTPFSSPTYKRIQVTVSWTDRNGSAQSIELDSNVAGIDPANSSIIM